MALRVRSSRAAGRALTGQPVMLCALAHDRGWRRTEAVLDALFRLLRGERGHCRACSDDERRGWGVADPVPSVLRLSGV